MWTTRRIDTFLHQQLSSKYLPMISDTATLRDALESATFFATSMGRIGADFSPLLPAFFNPRLISIVTSHWTDGLNALQDTLKVCREAGIASPLYNSREVISPIGISIEEEEEEEGISAVQSTKTPSPPRQLLSLPPLARLVNSFLTGLNELRRCLLASSFPQLRSDYHDSFVTKARAILVENERAVLKPGFLSKGEEAGKLRSVAVELKEEFDNCVEPYLANALEVSFGIFDNTCMLSNNILPENENLIVEGGQGEDDEEKKQLESVDVEEVAKEKKEGDNILDENENESDDKIEEKEDTEVPSESKSTDQ